MGATAAMVAVPLVTSAVGDVMQYGENRAARKRAGQITDRAMSIAGAGPSDAEKGLFNTLAPQLNTGQDSYLQYLRANPNALQPFMFDSSSAFKALSSQDALQTRMALDKLSAGAGSLGARYGTGFASRQGDLLSQITASLNARNAGIAQSSFNTALNTGFQDYSTTAGLNADRLRTLLSTYQTGIGAYNSRVQQQLQALGLGASTQFQQPSAGAAVSQGGGDIGSLILLSHFLGGGNSSSAPSSGGGFTSGGFTVPPIATDPTYGIPSTLPWSL